MNSSRKRSHDDGNEDLPTKKKPPTSFTLQRGSTSSEASSPGLGGGHYYGTTGGVGTSRAFGGRLASDDSLSDASSGGPGHQQASTLGSPLASPSSVYSTGSFDNVMASGNLDSPKPNYSHSSSSQKFQDYKSDDEDNHHGSFSMAGASAHNSEAELGSSTDSSRNRRDSNHERSSLGFFSEVDSCLATSNRGYDNGDNNGDEEKNDNDDPTMEEKDGASYSSVAQKMMSAMGYKPGKGLGASGTGRLEPIEASQQRGRRGLGHTVPRLKQATSGLTWDQEKEVVSAEEEVLWLPQCPVTNLPSLAELNAWVVEGPRKLNIEDEITYCDEDVLLGVLSAKNVFDELGEREIQRARLRSNPYETIGKVFFQNRAAVKMANLDAITDMMFTSPVDEQKRSLVSNSGILYFADVCAAPGGFAEYAIWRRKDISNGFPDVHGFGFTLRSNDFKLHDFYAAPREFFEPHYGKLGDGDIYQPSNIGSFCNFVKTATHGRGVHFMMADGGFSVDGQENIQEILSKQLYLGQFAVALGIVREGGHFVCKLFDTFTPFTIGLIYLMYLCFKNVALHKPNTSRPANSERYIICKWLRPGCGRVFNFLFEVNEKLCEFKGTDKDVVHLVPPGVMEEDTVFVDYIRNINNMMGRRQIVSLHKMQVFCEDNSQVEGRQGALRKECLQSWKVPDNPRKAPVREQPNRIVDRILRDHGIGQVSAAVTELLTPTCLTGKVRAVYNYRFVITAVEQNHKKKDRAFYLGLGGRNVYRNDCLGSGTWERIQPSVELPPETLVYAELVSEVRGMSVERPGPREEKADVRSQRRVPALHVIDGITLNGFYIGDMHLVDRNRYLLRFCEAINKTSRTDLLPLRCKTLYRLEHLPAILAPPKLTVRHVKNSGFQRVMYRKEPHDVDPCHIPVFGVLLIPTVKEPWVMAFSRTSKRKYFYNTSNNTSTFEICTESIADFRTSHSSSLFWPWRAGTVVMGNDSRIGSDLNDSDEEEFGIGGDQKKQDEVLHMKHISDLIAATIGQASAPAQQTQQQS